jgi:hypothetical protein
MVTDAPAKLSTGLVGVKLAPKPVERFVPKMLINSPRAALPVATESGAAFVIKLIVG